MGPRFRLDGVGVFESRSSRGGVGGGVGILLDFSHGFHPAFGPRPSLG